MVPSFEVLKLLTTVSYLRRNIIPHWKDHIISIAPGWKRTVTINRLIVAKFIPNPRRLPYFVPPFEIIIKVKDEVKKIKEIKKRLINHTGGPAADIAKIIASE